MRISTDTQKKALAVFLGSVFALSLLELGIRGIGYLDRGARNHTPTECIPNPKKLERKNRILILGNSFTLGVGAPPGKSYPDSLQTILDQKYPGRFSVFNCGVVRATTRFLLEHLQENLQKFKPTLVVAMNGQANSLNNYGFTDYLRESGQYRESQLPSKHLGALSTALRRLSSFRLVEQLQSDADSEINDESQGLLFLEKEADRYSEKCSPRKIEILEMLHERHSDWRRVCDLLAKCQFQAGKPALALEWIEKSLAINPKDFHYVGYRTLLELKTALPGPLEERFEHAFKKAQATYPGDQVVAGIESWLYVPNPLFPNAGNRTAILDPVSRRPLIEKAIEAEPNAVYSYTALAAPSIAEKVRLLKRGLVATLLPFAISNVDNSGARMTIARDLRAMAKKSGDKALTEDIQNFLDDFSKKYPHVGLSMMALENEVIIDWVFHDLKKLNGVLVPLGIPLLLQTFPPRRYIEQPWLVDSAIHQAVESEHIPLSDTFAEMTKDFSHGVSKSGNYPSVNGDEHLSEKGYARVAEILYESMIENQLIHP